ncbi:sodium:proton antiporter [Pseudomonas sp. RTC3]|uniref:sodium:proton antiporter n=1 Tax=unclassified Pseudomonas TaxID=196821 RepID=UPI002AB55B26|nr:MULTISPECIES: sodium:proton antiporter [unclassified Pseudomonas]MEB0063893.1 sodium:proton antiporter [Pseudomonas sp. RTC3]MDY7567658.1 sodium:proton antiporter [Pseudomonas sp. 5C2]MEB0007674.1 sodium:proton antiporter [Pseudomonas sp. RTB2]MEB0018673.1 sodium:proton antiporter [Pseudomonas sp. RTB3]MEB0026705.1 sodium:proton antiporter [Pseudomonas sp. MH9.2]
MMIALFWLLALLMFALATRLGRYVGLIPIVSQLLLATFGLPLLMVFWIEPHWQLSGAQLVEPVWLKTLYGLGFALVLGHILSDVIELDMDRQSLKIAVPSFCVPFCCGLACAFWLLPEQAWLSSLAVGLVFAITAIPVLFLYLHHIDYPPAATRRLVQTAILIDLTCWSLFAIAQGSLHLSSLLLPLLGACVPLLFRALRLRQPWVYSLTFFALLVVAEHYKLNALILGIGYLFCMAWLKQPFVLPLSPERFKRLQNTLAIPLILTFGIVQINVHSAVSSLSWLQLGALLALPIASKVFGNWLGLRWATPSFTGASRWRESLLLNIRGLSEIVFLNLLLQQQLISPALYFALMLMGLIATLMPAFAGMNRMIVKPAEQARSPCANS